MHFWGQKLLVKLIEAASTANRQKPNEAVAASVDRRNSPNDSLGEHEGLEALRKQLTGIADVVFQTGKTVKGTTFTLVYVETITDKKALRESLLQPLLYQPETVSGQDLDPSALALTSTSVGTNATERIVFAMMEGKTAVFSAKRVLLFDLKNIQSRGIAEARNEMVIVGPQEGFNENPEDNLSLLRGILQHPDLKVEKFILGRYTRTQAFLIYIEKIGNVQVLEEIRGKLQTIDRDAVMGASLVIEYLENYPFSPFPELQYTERPDTLAASLLEGRIGLLVSGTPNAIIAPVSFFTLMQSAEDYYQRFLSASWIRWIRYFFVLVSFLFPSVYVAITTFHPELLPASLLLTIAAARENIPFSSLIEAFIMEITFEALREAGIRIPKPIGQTISILGAIIIGQTAIQTGIVSAPTVIVVSMTGIATFIIPHYELGLSFRMLRFPVLLLGGTLGLLGVILAVFLIYLHMVHLKSFGSPYMAPLSPLTTDGMKDVFIRANWRAMDKRPKVFGTGNLKRTSRKK
ncbi:spore germination protein [Gorillibacterium massiliense]|uniref:spore germination protein n=1 Tax=Gorillibacterium massiliense TaxID=1280390 RepID=UPI0004BA2344|nr:spore germination protein [Gorillibacterium massiliense]